MEVVNVVKDLISNVGFPILAFLLMYKQNKDLSATVAENTKAINELRESLIEKNKKYKVGIYCLPYF